MHIIERMADITGHFLAHTQNGQGLLGGLLFVAVLGIAALAAAAS